MDQEQQEQEKVPEKKEGKSVVTINSVPTAVVELDDDEDDDDDDDLVNVNNLYLEPPKPKAPKRVKRKWDKNATLGCLEKVLEEQEFKENEKLVGGATELIEYMKEKWGLSLTRTKSTDEMDVRLVEKGVHKKPPTYWIQNRKREKLAEETALLSDITKPFKPIGDPELSVPLLILRNLPEYITINSTDWVTGQLNKAEELHRKEALLPRIPYRRLIRPTYTTGKINHGAGGTNFIDHLVKEAEGFQRGIKGSKTVTQLLSDWFENRENEQANKGSPFGMVKKGIAARTERLDSQIQYYEQYKVGIKPEQKYTEKRRSVIDDRTFQLEMAILEKMLLAILTLIKSILNVSPHQLKAQYRLPLTGVYHLRASSPEVIRRPKGQFIPESVAQRYTRDPSMYNIMHKIYSKNMEELAEPETSLDYKQNVLPLVQASKAKVIVPAIKKPKGNTIPVRRAVPDIPIDQRHIADIHPPGSAKPDKHLAMANRINEIIESKTYLIDPITPIVPPTVRQTIELGKQAEKDRRRFSTLFDKSFKPTFPIWHNVERIKDLLEAKLSHERMTQHKPKQQKKHRLSSLVSEATAKIRERIHIPHSEKIPNPDSIPTPTYPGLEDPVQLDSLEQSRMHLLEKMPDLNRNLYDTHLYQKLFKLADVKTTDKENFATIMNMKKKFHDTERKLTVEYEIEADKKAQGTYERFQTKVSAISDDPVYFKSIYAMRHAAAYLQIQERRKEFNEKIKQGKVPAKWYKDLVDKCESLNAFRHTGCSAAIAKLYKYCDLTVKARPQMLSRFALIVVSLPLSEIGTQRYQHAIRFLLDHLFEAPLELMKTWLEYRGVPYLF